nr:carboxyl transferase domain-containing protein [Labedaea rhizosphaerae]
MAVALAPDFAELPSTSPQETDGPLDWPGYGTARKLAAERTGERESVLCGVGTLGGARAVLIAFEFGFFGGSVGSAAGERVVRAFAHALAQRLPVVSLLATGGSRMQESMVSLRQLQRIAAARACLAEAGLPHVAVLRNPTTGGVWASLGASADVIVALAQAQIGFAGRRVRPPGDDHAYRAEGQFAAGNVDEVVTPDDLPAVLAQWLELLRGNADPAPVPNALGTAEPAAGGWDAVRLTRAAVRPRADAYLDDYFTARRTISGDRCGGVDDGVRCGVGLHDGRPIAFAAQLGTPTTPAGFRTATRLLRLADRLRLPVLTLVDTPGAANDDRAERAGLGPSIAELFGAIASARVPVTTLVIGEGGSGGALALAAPDNTWITPDAYFSVIAPELAAAILKRPATEVPAVADALRLRPEDLVALGAVRGIAGTR